MTNAEQGYTRPLGLDIGTSRIVVARNPAAKFQFDAQLNIFVKLPYSKLAAQLLDRENVSYEIFGADIVVAGNDAQRLAEVFHVETRRPMFEGLLNPAEPLSLTVVRQIITRLVGRAAAEGQRIVFSIPGVNAAQDAGASYCSASIRLALAELGYDATPIEQGLAVVFGELAESNFTGLGISCGSGVSSVCLARLSVPVFSFSVPKAGDFIDTQAALATGEQVMTVRVVKERSFRLNASGSNPAQNALAVYYMQVIANLIEALARQRLPRLNRAIPLVLSGGSVMANGFLEPFVDAFRSAALPIGISEVRIASDPLNSTARGALMAALN